MDSSPARCSQVNFLHLPLFFFAWGGTSQYDIIRDIYIDMIYLSIRVYAFILFSYTYYILV